MLDKIIKYGLYLLVFLLPLFFLPFTIFPVAQNKQMLLSVFAFLLLILWLIKIIISGKMGFIWNRVVLLLLLFLLILGISTLLSGARTQGLWGMNQEPDTFFNFILFGLVFLLAANLISINQLKSALISVLASSGVLSLLFLIQVLLKKPIFPWDFAQSTTFNPIGTTQALGVFLGGAFVMLVALATNTRVKNLSSKSKSILLVVLGILLFASIFLINYWIVWLGIALSLVIIMAEMTKSIGKGFSQKELKRFFLPLFVLVFSLTFIFIKVPTQDIVAIPPEISLTYRASFDIAIKTLKASPKNLILGSGPATFGYQYSLFRTADLNLTDFWQLRFNQGIAALLTFLTTFGVLGSLVILLLIGFFFYQGLKPIYWSEVRPPGTQLAAFIAGFYFLLSWFFYPLNFTLGFAGFLMLGLWTASTARMDTDKKQINTDKHPCKSVFTSAKIRVSFSESPQKAFFTMMLCVVLIVICAVGLYNVSQKYRAALIYAQGLELMAAEEPKLDEAIQKINQAALLDKKDVYFRDLSQIFLLKMNEILNNQELSQEQKQQAFQQVVSSAEMSATAAIQLNPRNSQNWLHLGSVYENLASFDIEGTIQLAILNYQKTQELDPQNPQIPLNMGRVYKSAAERAKIKIAVLEKLEQKDEKQISELNEICNQNLNLALEHFQKSLELKPNFSATYYLMAQTYEIKEDKEKAIENYKIVLQLEPGNEEIREKINSLLEQ